MADKLASRTLLCLYFSNELDFEDFGTEYENRLAGKKRNYELRK